MADSNPSPAAPAPNRTRRRPSWPIIGALLLILVPIVISVVVNDPNGFDPAPLPADYSFSASLAVAERHDRILASSKRVGEGRLPGPEDLAYDKARGFLYTGCSDGWIRRVSLKDEKMEVEDWAYVGGRPLGVALGPGGDLVVAESNNGLMIVKPDQSVAMLTDEADGLRFRLTDGVDVASDGLIYFTDASYKFNLDTHILDILEGRPHGRLMSFDSSTNQTSVLLRDLYFANGVSLSPDQRSLIFCETTLRRCRRYHIRGEKRGTVDEFIQNLPGFPDNVRYDGEGHYWIALAAGKTPEWDVVLKYPFLRKLMVTIEKFVKIPHSQRDSGILKVDLDGQPVALFSDPGLTLATSGLKIGKHLWYGSLVKDYLSRIDLTQVSR
ncbi:protein STRICTOSIDINE SYNTHASE-LIKE 4-like [Musa acuminata AAA Group]|uniref:protein STRICTOSIDINE SYNTHASE-LIKE 4 n=1 Tax=Musa acuminata AAA Group TaxID=214697 RepID=UPI0031E23C5C